MRGCSGRACVVALGGVCGCSGVGACMVALGGHAWLLPGGMHGCSGGMHGCLGGHAWLLPWGGHVWLLPGGACVVAQGGVHGIQ